MSHDPTHIHVQESEGASRCLYLHKLWRHRLFSEIAYASVFCVGHTQSAREREETSNRDRPYEVTTRECTFKFHGRANGMVLRRSWAPKRSMPICLSDDGPDGPGAQLRSFQRTHNVGTGGCESQGATRWPQKKAVAAAGPSRQDPLGQSIRSRLSHSSLAFPKTLLIASWDRNVFARQSQ